MADELPFFTTLPDGRPVVSLSRQYRPAEGDCCVGVRFIGNTPVVAQVLTFGSAPLEPEHLYIAAKTLEAQANAMMAAGLAARSGTISGPTPPDEGTAGTARARGR